MYRASDFRSIARKSLKGFWAITVLITLVAALLGGAEGFTTSVNVNVNDPENSVSSSFLPEGVSSVTQAEYVQLFTGGVRRLLQNQFIRYAAVTATIVLAIYGLVTFVIGGAIELGLCRYNLDLLTRENTPEFRTLFSRFSIFGRALGLQLMTGLLIILWSLLLIIPGIIATYRYALAPYLMAENPDMGIMEAIGQSKELMKGNKWRLFCLYFSFIGWDLLNALTLGIGSLWLNPYRNAAAAAFYLEVTGRTENMPKPDAESY